MSSITGKHADIIITDYPIQAQPFNVIHYDAFCKEKNCPNFSTSTHTVFDLPKSTCHILYNTSFNINEYPENCLFLKKIKVFTIVEMLKGKTKSK